MIRSALEFLPRVLVKMLAASTAKIATRAALPSRAVRARCYWNPSRHASAEWIAARVPVFSVSSDDAERRDSPTTADEADEIVGEAETTYASDGARSEFCRARGVDYDRFKRCAQDVRTLERAIKIGSIPT